MSNDDDYEDNANSIKSDDLEVNTEPPQQSIHPSMYATYEHFDQGLQNYPFKESNIDREDFLDYYQTLTSSHLQNLFHNNPDTAVQDLIDIYKDRKAFVAKRDNELKHAKNLAEVKSVKSESKGDQRVLGVREQIVNANIQKAGLEKKLREIHKDKEELEKLGSLDDEALENYNVAVDAKIMQIEKLKSHLDELNKQFYGNYDDDQTQPDQEAG